MLTEAGPKTLAEFGRRDLPTHEDRDEWGEILPGQWVIASCEEYQAAVSDQGLRVWASLTDPDGQFGEPKVYTLWGDPGTRPIAASLALYDRRDSRKVVRCIHATYVLEG